MLARRSGPSRRVGRLQIPGVGPDLLTWGQDLLSSDGFGTSFSAARLSGMVAVTAAYLATVRANLDQRAGRSFGVPLIGIAIVDRGFAEPRAIPDRLDLGALPVFTATAGAIGGLKPDGLDELVEALSGPTWPLAARSLLLTAAHETSSTPGLSAPSLSRERLTSWLADCSIQRLRRILGLNDTGGPERPCFDRDTIDRLWSLVEATMPIWQWDIHRHQPHSRSTGSS